MDEERIKDRKELLMDTINILNSIKVILEKIKEDMMEYKQQNIEESSYIVDLIEDTKLLMETMENGDEDVRK